MNKELEKNFKADQKDRTSGLFNDNPELSIKRDAFRRKQVLEILKKDSAKTGEDYYFASMIFHHGPKIAHAKKAISLARHSFELGYDKARWLYAAAIDRLLVKQNKKQKFGTQFYKKNPTDKWILNPIDNKITDEERAKFNVPTLNETRKMIDKMNKEMSD